MTSDTAITNMVKQQLRTGDVVDESILSLFKKIKREDFVPKGFSQFAYSDMRIPLDEHYAMMTPLEEGVILQALQLKGDETVLEVGTGSGFFTALLAQKAKHVITVDTNENFSHEAKEKLLAYDITNVTIVTGNGERGLMDKAPFDVMVFTGAIEKIGRYFPPQLMKNGKFFVIIGRVPSMQGKLLQLQSENKWTEKVLFDTCVAPLSCHFARKNFSF